MNRNQTTAPPAQKSEEAYNVYYSLFWDVMGSLDKANPEQAFIANAKRAFLDRTPVAGENAPAAMMFTAFLAGISVGKELKDLIDGE